MNITDDMLVRSRREWREFGATLYADTDTHTGRWCELEVVVAATFNALTFEGQGGTWTGLAFPVGHKIRGAITSLDLTSGTILAVNADPQRATLTTALAGANNDLVFSARTAGSKGNAITVAYVDPAAASQSLSVVVTASAIVVNLATNGGGTITSTSAQIKAAIEASERAANLVTVAHSGADTGAGAVIALTATALAGGAG